MTPTENGGGISASEYRSKARGNEEIEGITETDDRQVDGTLSYLSPHWNPGPKSSCVHQAQTFLRASMVVNSVVGVRRDVSMVFLFWQYLEAATDMM